MSTALTDKQQALLTRIIAGVEAADVSYIERASARALERRGLVTISGSGDSWRCAVTEGGRKWKPPKPPVPESDKTEPSKGAAGPLNDLMDRVLAAGGKLIDEEEVSRAQGIITAGLRVCDMPGEHVLRAHHTNRSQVVEAVPRPDWMIVGAEPVTVPERVARFHPAVRELRETTVFTEKVTASARGRAARILHALATEADRRGWTVECPITSGYQRPCPGVMRISVQGHSRNLYVKEEADRTPHIPSKTEIERHERYPHYRVEKYDHSPSGRLVISVASSYRYDATDFKDTKTTSLSDKLDGILRLIEYHAFEQEQRELERKAEAERERAAWERVRAQAEIDLQQHARRLAFDEQAAAWEQHRRREAYLAALSERVERLEGDERAAAREWLDWCRKDHAARDPWAQPIAAPKPVEATPDALQPFMRGLSPYGVHRW